MSAVDQLAEMAERIAELEQDSALLDALERMVLGSAEHGESIMIDARHEGTVFIEGWREDGACNDYASAGDLRAAIRAAMGESGGE